MKVQIMGLPLLSEEGIKLSEKALRDTSEG